MRVLAVDVYPSERPAGVEAVLPLAQLDDALGQAEVAVATSPLTPHRSPNSDLTRERL